MKREVLNLARFISVMKFRPLSWRMAHPYLLTDRLEVLHHTQAALLQKLCLIRFLYMLLMPKAILLSFCFAEP